MRILGPMEGLWSKITDRINGENAIILKLLSKTYCSISKYL